MLGINRDRLGRFAHSSRTWKSFGLILIGLLIYFWIHMFFSLYTIQNQRGVHGIISKATYAEQLNDHAKARDWDTTPSAYNNSDLQ